MTQELVALRHEGDVAIVELTSPGNLNALSIPMVEALSDTLELASRAARCVVLTGQGRGFCSGADLAADLSPEDADYDAGAYLDSHYNPLMLQLRALPVPLVTAVNGPAAGIGAALALSGDLVIASETAYFLQAFGRIGLVPDGGSAFLLVHAAGRARMMEMMLLGERISAAQALEWSMLNRVVPADDLLPTALSIAGRLASGPTAALGRMRRLGWMATERGFEEMLQAERVMQREAGQTLDHREGIAAFLEKRAPVFRGR